MSDQVQAQEAQEAQAPKTDLEDFRGLVEYITEDFWRPYQIAGFIAEEFKNLIRYNPDISDDDKVEIIFKLGRFDYALELAWSLYKYGPLGAFLGSPDNVKKITSVMSTIISLYMDTRDGKIKDVSKLVTYIDRAAYDIYVILHSGLEQLEK